MKIKSLKVITIILTIIMIIFMTKIVKATEEETYEIEFNITNNVDNKQYNVYILLPKEYIEYAIQQSNLEIEYNGSTTLKENNIPNIKINKEDVQEKTYEENNTEYVQILLHSINENKYKFNILKSYPYKDMQFRVTENNNQDYDYIVPLKEDFKLEDNICKVYYDYQEKVATNIEKGGLGIKPWQLILVVIIVIVLVMTIRKILSKDN